MIGLVESCLIILVEDPPCHNTQVVDDVGDEDYHFYSFDLIVCTISEDIKDNGKPQYSLEVLKSKCPMKDYLESY